MTSTSGGGVLDHWVFW